MLFLFQPQACRGETASLQYDHKRIVCEIADTIDKLKQHQQPTAASGTIEHSTIIQNAN